LSVALGAGAGGWGAENLANEPPAPPAPSTFAPADDLIAQIEFYLHRTEETLGSKDGFDDAAKTRLRKDANTLTALFLTLGLHDTENRYKKAAPTLVVQSQALAKAADFEKAAADFAELKEAAAGEVPSKGGKLRWEKAASLGQLMKQVPSINFALKHGLGGDAQQFNQAEKQLAANSAALAAIAQTALADTHEAKSPGEIQKWYQYCAEMRDAAAAVNAAVHAGDQQQATEDMVRLTKSCEDCHAVFRKDK
jgi:hypothetical protein